VQAKEGGVILSTPRRYISRVFLPSFLGWLCRAAVTGIFLAAFAIPVSFDSIMWVLGSGSRQRRLLHPRLDRSRATRPHSS
jgi:hypothetical protein